MRNFEGIPHGGPRASSAGQYGSSAPDSRKIDIVTFGEPGPPSPSKNIMLLYRTVMRYAEKIRGRDVPGASPFPSRAGADAGVAATRARTTPSHVAPVGHISTTLLVRFRLERGSLVVLRPLGPCGTWSLKTLLAGKQINKQTTRVHGLLRPVRPATSRPAGQSISSPTHMPPTA